MTECSFLDKLRHSWCNCNWLKNSQFSARAPCGQLEPPHRGRWRAWRFIPLTRPCLSLWAALPARSQLRALGITRVKISVLKATDPGPSLGMQGHGANQTKAAACVSQQTERAKTRKTVYCSTKQSALEQSVTQSSHVSKRFLERRIKVRAKSNRDEYRRACLKSLIKP